MKAVWRISLVVAVVAAFVAASWRVAWFGVVEIEGRGWGAHVADAPLWSPPPEPTFAWFADRFRDEPGFPRHAVVADRVRVTAMWDLWLPLAAVWVAGTLLVVGIVHRIARAAPDPVLAAALWGGIVGVLGVATSITLWFVYGGWGAPLLGECVGLGLGVGAVIGWRRPMRRVAVL